jgi:hexosaminidase
MTQCHGAYSEPLDPTKEIVYDFCLKLFTELFDLFTDPWLHAGGDEVWTDCWENNTDIRGWMVLHNMTEMVDLVNYFATRHIAMIHAVRRPIVWQDLYDMGVRLPRDVVHDIWKDWTLDATLFNVTHDGYDVVVSACWYLDHLASDWWDFYQCNPRDIVNGTAAQQAHVLGGHASMWGESVDATNFLERVWPRTSAVAEVLWSGSPTHHHTSPLHVELIRDRLADFRCWLVRRYALPASPIQPGYCAYGPVVDDLIATT